MKATANAPVVVASSSTTDNTTITNNRTLIPHSPLAEPTTPDRPPIWLVNPSPGPTAPMFPPNRPINSTSNLTNMPALPLNRPVNSAPSPINPRPNLSSKPNNPADTNNAHNSGVEPVVFSPRRRKNNGDKKPQSPRNVQKPQDSQSPLPQEPASTRILVTGYPTYTQPHDLLELFAAFGSVRLDKCNSWSATLTFGAAGPARAALGAHRRLHVYGHFLSVRPYSAKLKAEEGPQSPKRDFSKSKQKSVIIQPADIKLSGDFHTQLDMLMAAIRLNQEDINKITILYKDLENAFQPQWPGCKAIPFGSITTGLGIKTSDADCFIHLPPQFRNPHGNHVNKARRLLMQYPNTFTEILAIPRANTPIVKFYHVPTDTNCDLTFKTPLGAQNSRLIAFLLNADPRITPMAVIIKYWAKVHDLSGTGKLTNYALTMMIIFYLQQQPLSILPSVEWLQRDRANDINVDYWNTGFMSNQKFLPPISNTSTISQLLGGFFEYYSTFNFDEMVVCPYLGVPIRKDAFASTTTLPDEFALYKNNVTYNFVMPIRYQTSFCVQDPLEQCHNVASTITSKLASDIRTFFKFAATAYEKEKLTDCSGFLKSILLEKPKIVRARTHPEYRVNLFPRLINTILNPDWKSVVRELVLTIFENMMKVAIGKPEEKTNPDTKKEQEKYVCNLTKPIWKRKKYIGMFPFPNLTMIEKQTLISEELVKTEVQPVSLKFVLILTFCHDPKSAVITVRMAGGDLDAFREFGKFVTTVMQQWFTQLLKPHSKPDCTDTAAKIAETVDGDSNVKDVESGDYDEEEVVAAPSTTPAQDQLAAEDTTLTNSSDNNEEPGGATEAEDACANK